MASSLKPLKLWGQAGPNPMKVAIVLRELGIAFEIQEIAIDKVKSPEYVAINPNGRIPALYDPNTDITLWESGAIIEYVTEKYDTQHRFSFEQSTAESYHARQWLYFQATGQGPYWGQLVWFTKYHHEQLPSAIERYSKEVQRVAGVLESVLGQQKTAAGGAGDGPWLVGNKLSYADLAFIPWYQAILNLKPELLTKQQFPITSEWFEKMRSRKSAEDTYAQTKH